VSDFSAWRRSCRFGRSTSITSRSRIRKKRASPAP